MSGDLMPVSSRVERDPSCHLVEGRFVNDEAIGVRIDCEVYEHADRECPGEGVMFSDPRPSPSGEEEVPRG